MPRYRSIPWRATLALLLLMSLVRPLGSRSPARAGGLSPEITTQAYPPPPILARAAALLDADTGQWLLLKGADRPLAMASTTKIMTAVLTIEHGHLDDRVLVSRKAASIGETTMGLVAGERVRARDLLYGLLLPSGNDAAIALAEYLGGSVQGFARMMSVKAASLGMRHTHYLNPFGFFFTASGDAPNHYTTARDLVILANDAMAMPLFRQVVGTKSHVVPADRLQRRHELRNINQVLYWYPGVDGVKPGWTSGAGICQVIDVRRFGRHLIAALLDTPNLYTDARDLLDYGFGDFDWIPSGNAGDTIDRSIPANLADGPTLYYPFSGHRVQGAFLRYYEAHGGHQVLGFPRTEAMQLGSAVAQFFTNQVLASDHMGGVITAQRLGLEAVSNPLLLRRVPRLLNTSWRTYYPQTGHSVTYRFRQYYLEQGGPGVLGYPITEKVSIGSSLVQYFENSELIWHDSAAGGYISLAPLGQVRLTELGLLPGGGPHPPVPSPVGGIESSSSPTASSTVTAPASSTSTATIVATATPGANATAKAIATATPRPMASATRLPASPTPVAATPTWPVSTATDTASASATAVTLGSPSPVASPVRTVPVPGTDTPVAPAG